MKIQSGVWIFWFFMEDSRSRQERIQAAAEAVWGQNGKPEEWEMVRGFRGKPCLKQHPEMGLSITDNGIYWVCALSDRQIGIDLQSCRVREGRRPAEERYGKMAERFFHKKEAAYVREQDTCRRFFRVWAAKESCVKLTGRGIDSDFDRFSVLPEEGCLPEVFEGQPIISWQAGTYRYTEIGAPAGYTFCVCSTEPLQIAVNTEVGGINPDFSEGNV